MFCCTIFGLHLKYILHISAVRFAQTNNSHHQNCFNTKTCVTHRHAWSRDLLYYLQSQREEFMVHCHEYLQDVSKQNFRTKLKCDSGKQESANKEFHQIRLNKANKSSPHQTAYEYGNRYQFRSHPPLIREALVRSDIRDFQ